MPIGCARLCKTFETPYHEHQHTRIFQCLHIHFHNLFPFEKLSHQSIIKLNIKSFCPVPFSKENFLQIIIKAFLADYIFRKILCFQHILMNTFRWMSLNTRIYNLIFVCKLHGFYQETHEFRVKQTRITAARRRRKAMVKLKIRKPC